MITPFVFPFLLLFSAFSQGRTWVRGVVQQPGHQPRVGAEVLLVPAGLRNAPVLRVRSGKRGRFRISVQPGIPYLVWSHSKDAKGWSFFSELHPRVLGGMGLVLRERCRRPSLLMRLKGLEAWGDPKGLQVQWFLDPSWRFRLRTKIDSRGICTIPDPCPSLEDGALLHWVYRKRLLFVVKDRQGRGLFVGKLSLLPFLQDLPVEAGNSKENAAPMVLEHSCPRPQVLLLRGRRKGKRISMEGCKVLMLQGKHLVVKDFPLLEIGPWVPLRTAKTDEGLQIRIPSPKSNGVFLLVKRPGLASQLLSFPGTKLQVNGEKWKGAWKKGVDLDWAPGLPFTFRFFDFKGKGVPGVQLFFRNTYSAFGPSSNLGVLPLMGPTGTALSSSNGSLEFKNFSSSLHSFAPYFCFPPAHYSQILPKGFAYPLPLNPIPLRWWDASMDSPKRWKVGFKDFHLLPFVLLGPDGAPVPFPRVGWVGKTGGTLICDGDRRGRGSLIFSSLPSCFFGFSPGVGWFHQHFEDQEDFSETSNFVLPEKRITLRPFDGFFRGKVLGPKGKPVPWVSFCIETMASSLLQVDSYDDGALLQMNFELLRGRTDAKGRFSIPFIRSTGNPIIGFQKGLLQGRVELKNPEEEQVILLKKMEPKK